MVSASTPRAGTGEQLELCFSLQRGAFVFDIDACLPARGVTSIFGPSGCGKTTLLRCVAGLERVPRGRLCVAGETWQGDDVFLPVHRRPLGFVFQEANLFAHLSVLGNLEFGLQRSARRDARARARLRAGLDHAIELFGLGPLLQRKPGRLSGGEKQRVSIARALATSPQLLLMDEPLAALDHARKQEILPYLERLHSESDIPVLYVTHAVDEVARLADHLVLMEEGRITAQGPLMELQTRLDLPLQLGRDRETVVPGVVGALDAQWHLARIDFSGGELWTRDPGLTLGSSVRVGILASDVSLSLDRPAGTSIQNLLPVTVEALGPDSHPAQVLLRLKAGDCRLLASVTRRALDALGIGPGAEVWAQIKSVALLK